jgi:tRNA modification GTPase
MEKLYDEDIICACATATGNAAIGIIRCSGKNCQQILADIFKPYNNKEITSFKSHHAYYGKIYNKQQLLDDVLVLAFSEGKSFTGEESFEINCHGSMLIISLILRLLCDNGARMAEPGEFSKRAFLNGKVDLSSAEAIMDLVNASTKQAANIAIQQLTGRIKHEVDNLKEKTSDVLSAIEVYIDYPEEDLTPDINKWITDINTILDDNKQLIAGFSRGKYFRSGIRMALLGQTNVGKSTLFNYILNEDKAIVSDIHGTTRDYLDANVNICGYGVRIFDTAGLRQTDDPIEKEGTRRSIELSENADIVVYLISASEGITDIDKENLLKYKENKLICIINKSDLLPTEALNTLEKDLEQILENKTTSKIIQMSALNRKGLENFNNSFKDLLLGSSAKENTDPIITNERHAILLEEAQNALISARLRLEEEALDLAAFEIRTALNHLGEITGEVTPDDILNKIFSTFCVGK